MIILKHEAPRYCRIRRAIFGASPSAIFARCTLGLRSGCRSCKGCEHNVVEIWQEAREEALEKIKNKSEEAQPK